MQKIMFNNRYGLTEAVLEGRKTMTRRIITENGNNACPHWGIVGRLCRVLFSVVGRQAVLSRYAKGEVVAIAQSYKEVHGSGYPVEIRYNPFRTAKNVEEAKGWRNKMFVAAEYMPHHIKITDIKVERLQDISDEDCLREGIEWQHVAKCYCVNQGNNRVWLDGKTPREAFAALIDKVGKKGTWASNPWVFCYSFELID